MGKKEQRLYYIAPKLGKSFFLWEMKLFPGEAQNVSALMIFRHEKSENFEYKINWLKRLLFPK